MDVEVTEKLSSLGDSVNADKVPSPGPAEARHHVDSPEPFPASEIACVTFGWRTSDANGVDLLRRDDGCRSGLASGVSGRPHVLHFLGRGVGRRFLAA